MKHSIELLLLLVLVSTVSADNTVVFNCQQCGNVTCLVMTGGGYGSGYSYQTTNTSCPSGKYPITFLFTCAIQCPDCLLTINQPNQGTNIGCSTSEPGQYYTELMNEYYSIQINKEGAQYDWCGCQSGGLSGGAIAGIIVGCVVGAAIIGILIWYCCCKKKSFDNYTAM